MVELYTYYRDDSVCIEDYTKTWEEARAKSPEKVPKPLQGPNWRDEISRECRQIRYKVRHLLVDTRAKVLRFTDAMVLDQEGRHLAFLGSQSSWSPIPKDS